MREVPVAMLFRRRVAVAAICDVLRRSERMLRARPELADGARGTLFSLV